MTDLFACYFCGSVGDLTRHEVVPARLAPNEDEQRAVHLCATCRRKLTAITQPLVSRAKGASNEPTGDEETTARAHTAEEERATPPEGTEPDSGASEAIDPIASETGDDSAGRVTEEAHAAEGEITFEGGGEPDPLGADEEATNGTDRSVTLREEAGETDRERSRWARPPADEESGDADGTGSVEVGQSGDLGDEAVHGVDVADGVDDADAVDGGDDSDADDGGDGGTSSDSDVTVDPMTFRRVMRLLANREFPVERAAVEELAASAYDLDESEVAAIVDAAVKKGLVAQAEGELRQPE